MVRHDDDGLRRQGRLSPPPSFTIGLRLEHQHGKVELLLKLQRPLLADGSRADHQEPALTLSPKLAQHDPRLNRLSEAHFVRQDHAFGERRLQGEQRCFDLVWVEIDRGVEEGHRQPVQSTGGPPRQVVRVVLRMVGGDHRIRPGGAVTAAVRVDGRQSLALTGSVIGIGFGGGCSADIVGACPGRRLASHPPS